MSNVLLNLPYKFHLIARESEIVIYVIQCDKHILFELSQYSHPQHQHINVLSSHIKFSSSRTLEFQYNFELSTIMSSTTTTSDVTMKNKATP